MNTPFKARDSVWVEKLKKEGTVIERKPSGMYQVQVGSFSMECAESDLKPAPVASPSKAVGFFTRLFKRSAKKGVSPFPKPDPKKKLAVDLHGMTVEEAIGVFEKTVNRAVMEGYGCIEVQHGLGTGRVRQAIHDYLRQFDVASHFEVDQKNAGLTKVYF